VMHHPAAQWECQHTPGKTASMNASAGPSDPAKLQGIDDRVQ
jgi:hypothetical protein